MRPSSLLTIKFLLAGLLAAAVVVSFEAGPASSTDDTVVKVTAGRAHTCVLTAAGGVKCWGENSLGQIGDSEACGLVVCRTPQDVVGLTSGVIDVSAGLDHTCAVRSNGAVKCWGENRQGGLGDGTTTDRTAPVDVVGLGSGMVLVAAGGFTGEFSCALTEGGGVKCWGSNGGGQLGDGQACDDASCPTPVDVSGLSSGVTAISAGSFHVCALTSDTRIKCWGANSQGHLGDGTELGRTTPVDVCTEGANPPCTAGINLLSGALAVSAGEHHSCAIVETQPVVGSTAPGASGLFTNEGAQCWGGNFRGQLGDGVGGHPGDRSLTPVDVFGLGSGVTAVAAGVAHSCAVVAGRAMCWGSAADGRLGNGTSGEENFSAAPVNVCADETCAADLTGVVAVAAGESHTCAITDTGGVKCWGANVDGQLGDGSLTERTTPVDVVGFGDAKPTPTPTSAPASTASPTVTPTATSTATPSPLSTATPTSPPVATPTSPPGGSVGDANCDGLVTAVDAAIILQFSAGLIAQLSCPERADVNGDGLVNSLDAALVLQWVAGLLPALPP